MRFRDNLATKRALIEICEERLALSASLAADVLMELSPWGEIETDLVAPPTPIEADTAAASTQNGVDLDSGNLTDPGQAYDLFSQAEALRTTDNTLTGAGQTIAVIDSGIAWDHTSLGTTLGSGFGPGYRVVGGWDFAENDADPYDDGPAGYHGTHVASIIAGQSESFVGVTPEADIVALRVFDDAGYGQLQWIESALQWVHENQDSFESPITTVNLSVGAALSEANRAQAMDMLEDELALLREDNILVFAAAGNFFESGGSSFDELLYPASSSSVIPVSSIGDDGTLSSFAQRSDGILAANGETIEAAVPDHVFGWDGKVDDLAILSGTSMATPQVAATSMLIRQTLINEGVEPTIDAVLDRLESITQSHIDSTTGLSYSTIDLSLLSTKLPDTDLGPTDGVTEVPMSTFIGTDESDYIQLDLRDGKTLRVGDQVYSLEADAVSSTIVIDVRGGGDSIHIEGSSDSERLILQAQTDGVSRLITGDIEIELRGFEQITFVGGGGFDRASLTDSNGDDTLTSEPSRATLHGVGYKFEVFDVNQIYVTATNGGNDTAFLSDGPGDDVLAVRPQFSSIRGDTTFQLASGFERVYAFAAAGGFDSIEINDSEGDDTLNVTAGRTTFVGPGYHVSANGFESTTANSTLGGNDTAKIYSNGSTAGWQSTPDRVQWNGAEGEVRIARGFERVEAFEDFEPVSLPMQIGTQSINPIPISSADDRDDLTWLGMNPEDEARATRKIFESLGE
ncbi:Subtilisin E precursor [Rubripirellula amarantea]|uniref:Subtilisin E n=2 Tax=Rubripirellula amarantea TaxID=2527999 RepID=A0A5C5WSI3_9BACT|nr:Subtilisin E precursor [Rubripirellula amarantea]